MVIFIGQGFTGNTSPTGLGNLLFDNNSARQGYQPNLSDLRAKNTLFISIADFSNLAFQRAFNCQSIVGNGKHPQYN